MLHTCFIRTTWRIYAFVLLLFLGSNWATPARALQPSRGSEVSDSTAILAYLHWEDDYSKTEAVTKQLTSHTQANIRYWGYIIEAALAFYQGEYTRAMERFDHLQTALTDRQQRYALLTEQMRIYQVLGHTDKFFTAYMQWQQMTRHLVTNATYRSLVAEYAYARGFEALYRYYVEVGNSTLAIEQLNKLSAHAPKAFPAFSTHYERCKLYTRGKALPQRLEHLDAALAHLDFCAERGDANTQIALLLDIASWLHSNGETAITGHRQAQLQLTLTPHPQSTVVQATNTSWQALVLQRAFTLIHQQRNQRYRIEANLARAKYHTQQHSFDTAMHDLQEARQALPQVPMRAIERNIYEQASIVAIALGDKPLSDKFHNAYLDLLNLTRLDKTQEATLRQQQHALSDARHTLIIISVAAVLFLALCAISSWLWLRNKRQREAVMKQILHDCNCATRGLPLVYHEDNKHLHFSDLADSYEHITAYIERIHTTDHTEEQLRDSILEDQALAEHQLLQNKRTNVELRAKMLLGTGPIVYIDRLLHLLAHHPIDTDYGQQLVQRILTINQHLTTWVQMKTGKVNIRIETFDVHEVLTIAAKAAPALQAQGITLNIQAPEAFSIKADKALTLFMLNTLVDNARKHTPKGGSITIQVAPIDYAEGTLAEIAVADTGTGIEPEQLKQLLHGKHTYDQKKHKGFGLSNCRGIMERYRKGSQLFAHCELTGSSIIGQGTRFAFTLPRGAMALLIGLSLLFGSQPTASAQTTPHTAHIPEPRIITIDSTATPSDSAYDHSIQVDERHTMQQPHPYWTQAQHYVDSIYRANVTLNFPATLRYADSALHYINAYVAQQPQYAQLPHHARTMHRYDSVGSVLNAPEVQWHAAYIRADYSLFLDLRNELAIAYLGLGLLDPYEYNNEVYLQLYRCLTHNPHQQARINEAINSTRGLHIAGVIFILAVFILMAFIYIKYLHSHIVHDGHLRQQLKASLALLTPTALSDRFTQLFTDLGKFTPLSALGITVIDEEGKEIYTFRTADQLKAYDVEQAQEQAVAGIGLYQAKQIAIWPMTHPADPTRSLGHITLLLHDERIQSHVVPYISAVLDFVTQMAYTTIISEQKIKDDITLLQDQLQVKEYDSKQLYVQNALIENTLSALKHETMYFPTRLAQLLTTATTLPAEQQAEQFQLLESIAQHYRELSQVLLLQATQQFSFHAYRWQYTPVRTLYTHLKQLIQQHNRVHHTSFTLHHPPYTEASIYLEPALAEMLVRHIWSAISSHLPADAQLHCSQSISDDGRFALATLTLPVSLRQAYPIVDQLHCDYFAAEAGIIPLLICKNIIRMHDHRTFHAGYRISITDTPHTTTITTAWLLQSTTRTS